MNSEEPLPSVEFASANISKRQHMLRHHVDVLSAVILQDMKTRFGGNYASYLIAVTWPLAHAAFLIVGYVFVNTVAPVGEDPVAFVATGVIPFMIALYPSRMIGQAIIINRPFLSYGIIQPLHLILARCVLELLNAALVVIIILLGCLLFDRSIIPDDLTPAAIALATCVLFGISFGTFTAVFTAVLGHFFGLFSGLVIIMFYFSSLSYLPRHLVSSDLSKYIQFNPFYILITRLRSAYFPSYGHEETHDVYLLMIIAALLFLGLASERLLRGRMLLS